MSIISQELDSERILRILAKLGTILERPEYAKLLIFITLIDVFVFQLNTSGRL